MSEWSTLKERVGGKWQLPLFVLSLMFLGAALLRLRPTPQQNSPQKTLESIDTLVSEGFYGQAIEFTEVFAAQEGRTEADRAQAELRLARARYGDASERRLQSERVGRAIVDSYHHAEQFGLVLTGDDFRRLGEAFEWQDRTKRALSNYARAIELGVDHRSDLRKRMIELLQRQPEQDTARIDGLLDALLAEVSPDRLDLRLWATEEKVYSLDELGRLQEAATLLVREKKQFQDTDLRNHFGFIEALYLYKSGRFDESARSLRSLRNRLERSDDVHAMSGWLLGRVVLNDADGPARPEEALSFFQDVLAYHPKTLYAAASRVGMAESLVALERHDEAIAAYRIAVTELGHFPGQHLVNRDVLRSSLAVAAETQRIAGHFQPAVAYARLATNLVTAGDATQTTLLLQQLAQTQAQYADDLERRAEARRAQQDAKGASALSKSASEVLASAGETSLRLAKINTLNDRLSSEWSWRAAEFQDRAGHDAQAVALYRTFTVEHSDHSFVPRALLRIGQRLRAMGKLPDAVAAFQEVYRRFPRTLEGSRALVPLAHCYLEMGPKNAELAEKTLRVLLEDSDVLTPDAPEFAEALYLLGDVLERRKQYTQAIATLEEAADRYPDDPRIWRSRFLLADAYRQSALSLKEEAAHTALESELRQMREESQTRFDRARELYRDVITEYTVRGSANLDRLQRLFLRHAMLYEADCFFETNRYREALQRYEEAASVLQDSTSALSAYVQIINCNVFLGQRQEARATLARALIVVDAIPQATFDTTVSPETRQDWKGYFEWLGASGLF